MQDLLMFDGDDLDDLCAVRGRCLAGRFAVHHMFPVNSQMRDYFQDRRGRLSGRNIKQVSNLVRVGLPGGERGG